MPKPQQPQHFSQQRNTPDAASGSVRTLVLEYDSQHVCKGNIASESLMLINHAFAAPRYCNFPNYPAEQHRLICLNSSAAFYHVLVLLSPTHALTVNPLNRHAAC